MKKIAPILLAVVVIAVAGYFAWPYITGTTGAANGGLSGSGTIEADAIAVTPQASGRIIEAPAEEGMPVKKGDILYRLDPALMALQVQQAQAGVNAADANWRTMKDDNGSKSAEADAAKAQLEQAQVALQMAQVQVGYMTIASPIDGVLANIAARLGENAAPGNTLAIVSNPASLTVTIYIPENEIGKVVVGRKATLTTDSTDKTYNAEVVFIGTQAEFTPASIETKDQRVKLVYQVKLRIIDADEALKPGMPADAVLK